MLIDVLSERGYQCQADAKETYIPVKVDKQGNITCDVKRTHMFHIKFRAPSLRVDGIRSLKAE